MNIPILNLIVSKKIVHHEYCVFNPKQVIFIPEPHCRYYDISDFKKKKLSLICQPFTECFCAGCHSTKCMRLLESGELGQHITD